MENKEAVLEWGQLTALEGTMQITGSMLNMRNPKMYKIEKPKSVKCTDTPKLVRDIPVCQYTKTALKIQEYINDTEIADIDKKKLAKFQASIPTENSPKLRKVLSAPPLLEPKFESQSYGLRTSVVEALIRKSVATIAFKAGFIRTTNSALDMLEYVTSEYFNKLSKSLKLIYENQAITGRTGMYDAVDQVLHDHGAGNVNDLVKFYKHDVIEHSDRLIKDITKKVQTENRLAKKKTKPPIAKIKSEVQEQDLSWTYPMPEQSTSSRWLPFVKTESISKAQASSSYTVTNQVGEHSAYINTFRPISPQNDDDYKPNKKKMRGNSNSTGFSMTQNFENLQ